VDGCSLAKDISGALFPLTLSPFATRTPYESKSHTHCHTRLASLLALLPDPHAVPHFYLSCRLCARFHQEVIALLQTLGDVKSLEKWPSKTFDSEKNRSKVSCLE